MRKLLLTVSFLILTVNLFAETNDSKPFVIGETITLKSDILNEDRQIMISKPAGYDQSSAKYPVMYLLDGNTHFHHTTGIIQFLSSVGNMPQMIVVAIPNTQRTRDLTPATSDTSSRLQNAGGADNFLKFIRRELMPHVESNYRTQPYKLLVGHSFGGLFAINTLLTHPESFDAYVAISPSLWWDTQRLVDDAKPFFQSNSGLNKFLFVTLGNEGGNMLPAAQAFVQVLERNAPSGLDWQYDHMENETHGSIPHRTTYNALEKLYMDWRLPLEIARTAILADFDTHFEGLSRKFGYEIITPELTVNRLGYRYLGTKEMEEAIAVFKRNVAVYPESTNVYDSLGDAYDAAENFELALKNYEIAYKNALKTSHPNLQVYKNNFERLQKKFASN